MSPITTKRTGSILLALALTAVIAGCTAEASEQSDTAEPEATPAVAIVPPAEGDSELGPTDEGDPASPSTDIRESWAYGLVSIRTGELLVTETGEHQLDASTVSFGYNLVVDSQGNVLAPSARPLQGGEQLVATPEYQQDHNTREYARILAIMAPIRDALLYNFEDLSRAEWLDITEILTANGIKTEDATVVDGRSILSTNQVFDYIQSGNAQGSPVARYLEEAGLELKCLAFQDFDFTNPEGNNHCEENNLEVGSGIVLP